MDRPRLRTALVTRGHTKALKDGTITPRTFDFQFEEVPTIIQAFRRMVRALEFDISEMAITTYLCARAHGVRFTAVPIFPMRAFHHGAIVYNTQTGIRTPQDLEGQRVGVNRGYTVTTGLWARGILQHQYNVDLSRITWVLSGDEHVAQYRPPSNVVAVERGRILEDLVTSGEIPAAIGVQIDAPHVQPLIPHATDAAVAALRADGLYPINHTLVVRDDVLRAHPDLAQDLVEVFAEARRLYVGPLAAAPPESLSAHDAFFRRVLDSTGDPLPCGIEPNRRMIETVIQYSVEQGILARPVTVEEVFWTGSS